jgi:hypothetical protein
MQAVSGLHSPAARSEQKLDKRAVRWNNVTVVTEHEFGRAVLRGINTHVDADVRCLGIHQMGGLASSPGRRFTTRIILIFHMPMYPPYPPCESKEKAQATSCGLCLSV